MSDQSQPARRAPTNRLDFKEQLAIHEALKGVLVSAGDGAYTYSKPHTDETVAAAMDFTCSVNSVSYIRRQMFGPFPAAAKADPASLKSRVVALEAAVARLIRERGGDPADYGAAS